MSRLEIGVLVIPAQAGIQIAALDSRLREKDEPENQESIAGTALRLVRPTDSGDGDSTYDACYNPDPSTIVGEENTECREKSGS